MYLFLHRTTGFTGTFCAVLLMALVACHETMAPDKPDAAQQVNPTLLALTKQLEVNPRNDSLYFHRAAVYYQLEGYDEAIADLTRAIALDSLVPQYYHLLSDVLMDYNKSYQAMRTMEWAVSKFPDRVPTLLKMSETYLIVKKDAEALEPLNKILQKDPQNADAFYMTGRVAFDMGEEKRAIVAFKKSLQLDAENAEGWEFLGRVYANQGNPQALQCYDNALRLDSTNNDIRVYKGMYHKQRGEYDKAFAAYRDVIVHDPTNADPYFDLGMIYLEQDSLDKSYQHFDLAIKNAPLFVKAFYYRGVVSEQKGTNAAALADFERASKMSPSFKEAKEGVERLKK